MSSSLPQSEDDDAHLIARFLSGRDAEAFRTLYRRHASAVYGLLCRLSGGNESEAADLLQEAWMRAATRLEQFAGRASFRTWVSGIAVNCYREAHRRRREATASEPIEIPVAPNHARSLDVEQVVMNIPPHYREVLLLHDVEGFTHEHIAELLGLEVGTSKSRLARARQIFRSLWGPRGER